MPELDLLQEERKVSWSGWSWPRRVGYVSMTIARYLLGLGMFPYAWSKINYLQFQVEASTYAMRLGEVHGISLTWAYLGYQPAFQVLLGVLEGVPALLLLWSRTRRLGAILMFPVLLNVVLVNFFFDLWRETRIISSVLLGLNIFLLAYDWRLFWRILRDLIANPLFIARRPLRIVANVSASVLPFAAILGFVVFFHQQIASFQLTTSDDFIGIRQINRAGTWKLASLTVEGNSVIVDPQTRIYFDFTNQCSIWNGSTMVNGTFSANKVEHAFHIEKIPLDGDSTPFDGVYRAEADRLFLNGRQGKRRIDLTLVRDSWGQQHP